MIGFYFQLSEDREIKPSNITHNLSATPSPSISPGPPHSVVHVEDQGAFSRGASDTYQAPARRLFQDIRETKGAALDHDEDKYKRRPAGEWVRRWWK